MRPAWDKDIPRCYTNGGKLLLCSDGLWGVVPNDEILDIINHADNPQDACEQLIHAAILGGGPDNITTMLVQFPPEADREYI